MAITIRAAALRNYADLAREIGLDPLRLLDRVGIPRIALDNPDLRISAVALRDLYELCGQTAEDWALRLMARRSLAVLGPVLLVGRDQATVREVIAATIRYNALHHDATFMELEEADDLAIIRLSFRYETPGPSRQVAEGSVLQVVRLLRLYLGPDWRPLSVSFMHASPAGLDTHRRAFGTVLLFNQDFHGCVFPRSDLDARNPSGDPEMARLTTDYAESLVRPGQADITVQVREAIEGLLRSGRCNVATVAGQLNLDPRTLQRHLAHADTSFQAILQQVRLDLAVHYLDESDRPLAEVAELLGFSALSAFSRWHRANTGVSASDRRQAGHPVASRLTRHLG